MPKAQTDTAHFFYNQAGFWSMRPESVEVMTRHLIGSRGLPTKVGDIELQKNIGVQGRDPEALDQIGGQHNYSYSLRLDKTKDSLVIKPGYTKDDGGNMKCHGAVVIKATHEIDRSTYDHFYVSNGVRNIQRVEETFGPVLDELAAKLERSGGRGVQRGGAPSSGRPRTGLTEADAAS